VFVIAKHQELLHQLGLDMMDGVKQFKGELIKNHKGQRDIQRISRVPVTQQTINPTLFLKRNWRPYKKDGLNSLFTRGQVWSQSRVEWENSLALQRAGINVAEPVAFGEECGLLWEKFSFILTAAAAGEMTMDDFLRTNQDLSERKTVFEELARQIRKMHDAGLASPDLFTRHIFIARGSSPQFCLIDMARMDRHRSLSELLRARDLAALHVTAPLRFVSTPERQRFLEVYGASAELRELISQRAKHLLTRKKFADFSAEKD
jgi:tRNA A-37 threonylcarbamoyl transferase component Bud32